MRNKYEVQLVRNEIDELWLIELSVDFWRDEDNWPEWFKKKATPMEAPIMRPTKEDYEHGFMRYPETLTELTEEQKYSYEFDGWKPYLFVGFNVQGTQYLTEDSTVGYSPAKDKLIFGPRWMFDLFFNQTDVSSMEEPA